MCDSAEDAAGRGSGVQGGTGVICRPEAVGSRCSGGSGHFPPNPQAGGWRVAPQGTSGSSLSWCFIRGSHGSPQQGPGRAGQVRPHPDAAQGGRLVRAWPPSAVWSVTKAWEGASPGTCRSSGRQGGGRQGPRLSVAVRTGRSSTAHRRRGGFGTRPDAFKCPIRVVMQCVCESEFSKT